MAPALHSYFCSATKCRHHVGSPQKGTCSKPACLQATFLCSRCAMAAVAIKNASITTIRAATVNNTRLRLIHAPFRKGRGDQPRLRACANRGLRPLT
jgi:hypothetical protein